jgi:arylsulfatase A-like enzyme
VIFTGDNGYYKGSRGFAGKWSHFEESLRVPLVIYDPRLAADQRGRVVSEMALNVDLPATMMALATGQVPADYQGEDLSPLTVGQPPEDWRTDFFCEHLFDHRRIPKWEGVRDKRYVYARYFEHLPEGEFLHDLEEDPLETENLVDDPAYDDVLKQMRSRCDELQKQYGGPYAKK